MSDKKIIHTENAPAAIGPYSQAVQVGNITYFSGQIPLDPKTMTLVEGDFKDRAKQVFENLKAVAEAAGGSLSDIVKVNLYLTDLSQFADVNEVMKTYFSEPYPARAAVGAAQLPMGTDVEAEAVMIMDQ